MFYLSAVKRFGIALVFCAALWLLVLWALKPVWGGI